MMAQLEIQLGAIPVRAILVSQIGVEGLEGTAWPSLG